MQWVRIRNGNRPSAVGMVTRLRTGQVGDRGSIPGKVSPLFQTVQTDSAAQHIFNSVGTGYFPEVM
jgi:hypothetical protein